MPVFVTMGDKPDTSALQAHAVDLDFEEKYELYKAAVRKLYENCVEIFGEDVTKRCITRMNEEAAKR